MPRKKAPLESDFQDKFLKALRKIPGSWWVKLHDRVTIGLPDVVGCVNGAFVAIELKRDQTKKSDPSHLQKYNLRTIRKCGGASFVAAPENANEVLHLVIELGTKALHGIRPPRDRVTMRARDL